jgi:hypothetical protein
MTPLQLRLIWNKNTHYYIYFYLFKYEYTPARAARSLYARRCQPFGRPAHRQQLEFCNENLPESAGPYYGRPGAAVGGPGVASQHSGLQVMLAIGLMIYLLCV